jgi:hypothetical protein
MLALAGGKNKLVVTQENQIRYFTGRCGPLPLPIRQAARIADDDAVSALHDGNPGPRGRHGQHRLGLILSDHRHRAPHVGRIPNLDLLRRCECQDTSVE